MFVEYRKFLTSLEFNNVTFYEVWIDPHYEDHHRESINDDLILNILKKHSGVRVDLVARLNNGFHFYELKAEFEDKKYKLIITIPPDEKYLGIRNTYRIR